MHTKRVVVYSTIRCPFCDGAKALLTKRGVDFTEVHMGSSVEDRNRLVELTGGSSFPQIVIEGRLVGGFEELRMVDRLGKLSEMLKP